MEDVFDLYAESPIRSAQWSALTKDRPSPSSLRPISVKAGQLEHYELRLQVQRHCQSVHLPRRTHRPLAQGRHHRQPRRGRLRRLHARPSPPSLLKGRAHPGRAGQYAHPPRRRALPSFPAGRSAPPPVSAPVPPRPKHASWLSMVEIEIGVLRSQFLDQRIQWTERILSEVGAWERQCNASRARIKWTFTTEKARAKAGALTSAGLRPKRHNHRAKNQSLSPPPLVCTH